MTEFFNCFYFQMCSIKEHDVVDRLIDGEKGLCGQIDKNILLGRKNLLMLDSFTHHQLAINE